MADPRHRAADPTLEVDAIPATTGAVPAATPSSTGSSFDRVSSDRLVIAHRYEILGLVGHGGMGTVYRALDRELDEIVALKVLRREIADTPGALESFRREVKLARRVTHHNVARVFDIGEHDGDKFLTMELVDGESLTARIAQEGAFDLDRAAAIVSAIAAGLASAHAAGVVHRDLKPDNVLLARDGRVVVTDFSIARAVLESGAAGTTLMGIFGTPAYMAPEQVEGQPGVDARADIYALGAVFYELVTGERAWPGTSPFLVASARLASPPPDPRLERRDLPAPCAQLILRCMARRREDRPASIQEVAAALAAITFPAPVSSPPVPPPPSARPRPDAGPAERTVAVLPFHNGGPPEDGYLAEELTDDLIDALSMTRGLKVRPRGVVSRFRGADQDAREVGRSLDVQVVVLGSVRRARGSVRISVRLVSVADGFQLWAKRIERPEQEVLAVNDDVAAAIAEALTLDVPRAARELPSSPVAMDLYLRARHEYRRFWPEHQRRAIELFEQAASVAPEDPMILSGLALALSRLSFFAGSVDKALARKAAERAVAAAPHLSESHLALGSVLLQLGEAKAAMRELRHAVGRGPGLAEAHSALGRLLVEIGAAEEGMWRLDAALSLDPDVPLACGAQARAHALLGQWDAADALVARLRGSEGTISFLALRARMALWRRLPGDAYVQEASREMEHGLLWAMGEILETHRLPDALPTLDDLARSVEGGARRRALFFQMHAEMTSFLGDHEQTLAALTRADDCALIDLFWLDRCPLFDPIRDDPRFTTVRTAVQRRAAEILDTYRSP